MRRLPILSLILLSCVACTRAPERPNVLLITVDTLRADRLSSLGSLRATTPCLDRLAAQGLVFTHAESPRSKTTPAIVSLFTGLYPHDHGARELLMPVARTIPLLPQRFRDAGYRAGAIVGNFVLKDEHSGLQRGFDQWTEALPQTLGVPPDLVPQRTARSLTDGALAALGLASDAEAGPHQALAERGQPWFLWLHYMDPHGLYDPPPEHRVFHTAGADPIPPDPGPKPGELYRHHVAEYNVPASARLADGRIDANAVRDLYDGEVHYVDAEIGRLIDALRESGELARTLIVVTADHGESLGEHQYWFEHGRDAYEAGCRVPLLVVLPENWKDRPLPGRRDGDVSLVDLAPTLLDLVRLSPLGGPSRADTLAGVSRSHMFLGGDHGDLHPVFVEKVERAERSGIVQHKGVRIGDWKLLRRYAHSWDERTNGPKQLLVLSEELYDLAADPQETKNLIRDPPKKAPLARLQAELLRFSAADVRFPDLAAALQKQRDDLERNDKETLRIIEALGY